MRLTDISIQNYDLFPFRKPLEEEQQLYDLYMQERSPITAGVSPDILSKLKDLHDKGMRHG